MSFYVFLFIFSLRLKTKIQSQPPKSCQKLEEVSDEMFDVI